MIFYIILGIILIWLVILTYKTFGLSKHYENLIQGVSKRSLREILEVLIEKAKYNKALAEEISRQNEYLKSEQANYIQKVGVIRYNPFPDTGGENSFIIALLDAHENGILLTSLHTRGVTRWYSKTVKGGKGLEYELNKEEMEAIKKSGFAKNLKL